ncbi:MAG TPA: hypothetical protein VJJ80_02610 [Patescibacteria group bacterium]|nr:hypothetical protein [Patescibacteria group bacterium]
MVFFSFRTFIIYPEAERVIGMVGAAKAIFITYNSVGIGREMLGNGWHGKDGEHQIFIASTESIRTKSITSGKAIREKDIDGILVPLADILHLMDEKMIFVIYLGGEGHEHIFSYLYQIPAERIVFVMCECDRQGKMHQLREHRLLGARRIDSECGGELTMKKLADHFLTTGQIPETEEEWVGDPNSAIVWRRK